MVAMLNSRKFESMTAWFSFSVSCDLPFVQLTWKYQKAVIATFNLRIYEDVEQFALQYST